MIPTENDIAEKNIERLLGAAYKPETPDPVFAQTVTEYLCSVAKELAEKQPGAQAGDAHRYRGLRRRLGWGMAAAACVAVCGLVIYARYHPGKRLEQNYSGNGPVESAVNVRHGEEVRGLVPRPRPALPQVKPLSVGERLTTKAGERRRLTLADGSILYLNQNTEVTQTAARRLVLTKGEVYLEVAQGKETFVVKTPGREVVALGTHFAVQAKEAGTGVVVTQGKVEINGKLIQTGQQIEPGDSNIQPAPRASHLLDWTRALMTAADAPLVPTSKHAGGALLAIDPNGQEIQLSLRKYHIDVHIEDGFARTTIDQTYFNNEWARLEGTFYFPLPADATLSRLAMYVEENGQGRLMEGGMAEREHARTVFETIMHTRRDPALLEWVDGTTFKMRVFPLEGRKEKRIILSYTQRLSDLYGTTRYRFPGGSDMAVVNKWSFQATIKGGAKLNLAAEPNMTITQVGKDAVLTTQDTDIKPDRDVSIEMRGSAGSRERTSARFSEFTHENAKYLMVRFRPELAGKAQRQRRDWVILFESSANRDPLLARAQIDLVRYLLLNAEHDDTFVLLTANTRVRTFDQKARPATPKNIDEAVKFLESTHLVGALDLENALKAARPFLESVENPHLVHLGVGLASLGENRDDALVNRIPKGTRYLGLGVGKRWNRTFMKLAAERTAGYYRQVNPDESLAWHGFDLLATLNTPRLLDVRVADKAGKAIFLSEATMLSQGEEICAITKLDESATSPSQISVTGTVDGKRYSHTLNVRNIADGAGYLPRAWAKLELDRLQADGAEKNKQRIIELSKASYVMSPFTSLLVLETDADYERFKVDRGRKDHWAMYPCPDRIPIVYEPGNQFVQQPPAKEEGKKPVAEVLQTILVRVPPRVLRNPQNPYNYSTLCLTAAQIYAGAYLVMNDDELEESKESKLGATRLGKAIEFGRLLRRHGGTELLEERERLLGERWISNETLDLALKGRISNLEQLIGRGGNLPRDELDRNRLDDLVDLVDGTRNTIMFADRKEALFETWGHLPLAGRSWSNPMTHYRRLSSMDLPPNKKLALDFGWSTEFQAGFPFTVTKDTEGFRDMRGYFRLPGGEVLGTDWAEGGEVASLDMYRRARYRRQISAQSLLYHRPVFTGDRALFDDLTIYAPGLNTMAADIQAVIQAEAKGTPPLQGKIDPAAKALIEKARSVGWQVITIPEKSALSARALTVQANGAGRYIFERVLWSGLKETVVCDDTTLLHLYPEIGLGAKRKMSPFHRAELGRLVPWALPPVEDLARGADVKALSANTIAIMPLRATPVKKEKIDKTVHVHLVFADDGRLRERRVVLMPDKKTVQREVYRQGGTVTWFDRDDKQIAEVKLTARPGETPDLKPDTAKLVVVPMPLRNPADSYTAKITGWNGDYSKLDEDMAVSVIAADCWQYNWPRAQQAFKQRFESQGDRRPGFYVLLTQGGYRPAKDAPGPLMKYLANLPQASSQLSVLNLAGLGPKNGFIQRLATVRDLWVFFNSDQANPVQVFNKEKRNAEDKLRLQHWQKLQTKRSDAFEFLQDCPAPFAFALLATMEDRAGNDRPFHHKLGEQFARLADEPGLGYAARYEQARCFLNGETKGVANQPFEKLYADMRKEGALPLIDNAFIHALEQGPYQNLMRRTSADLIKDKRFASVLTLAWQNNQLGQHELANDLVSTVLAKVDGQQKPAITLAAIDFLVHSNRLAQADRALQDLLADEKLAALPGLWHLAADLAKRRGITSRAALCLEKALDMEYRHLPEVINLKKVREDYTNLLTHYHQLAVALTAIEKEPPKDFVARVVRAADRWRALDSESTQACQLAAKALQAIGARDLAWDYLTTPIAQKPNESGPWLALAHTMQDSDFDLADRAFGLAYKAEPTNAQILWDHAQYLHQFRRFTQAQEIYRQLAEGDWQPRFQNLREQARQKLER